MKFPQIKILKSKKHIPEALKERSSLSLVGRDPYIDWFISITVATIIALLLIVMGIMNYFNVMEKINKPVTTKKSSNNNSLDTKTLNDIINDFDRRAEIRKDLINGYSGLGDPSL